MVKHNSRTRFRFSTQLINLIKFKLVLLHGKVSKNQEPALKACVEPGQTIQKAPTIELENWLEREFIRRFINHWLTIIISFQTSSLLVQSPNRFFFSAATVSHLILGSAL